MKKMAQVVGSKTTECSLWNRFLFWFFPIFPWFSPKSPSKGQLLCHPEVPLVLCKTDKRVTSEVYQISCVSDLFRSSPCQGRSQIFFFGLLLDTSGHPKVARHHPKLLLHIKSSEEAKQNESMTNKTPSSQPTK